MIALCRLATLRRLATLLHVVDELGPSETNLTGLGRPERIRTKMQSGVATLLGQAPGDRKRMLALLVEDVTLRPCTFEFRPGLSGP